MNCAHKNFASNFWGAVQAIVPASISVTCAFAPII